MSNLPALSKLVPRKQLSDTVHPDGGMYNYYIQIVEFGDSPVSVMPEQSTTAQKSKGVTQIPISSHTKNTQVHLELHQACRPLASLTRR